MRPRIFVLALALVAVLLPAVAIGQTTTSHRITANIRLGVIDDNPPSGSVYAGELTGKPLGRSAIVLRNQLVGTTSTGKAVIYAKRGTIKANVINELQVQPDGTAKLPGTFKITGGTGLYKGATGKGRFDASTATQGGIIVVRVTGKIRY